MRTSVYAWTSTQVQYMHGHVPWCMDCSLLEHGVMHGGDIRMRYAPEWASGWALGGTHIMQVTALSSHSSDLTADKGY